MYKNAILTTLKHEGAYANLEGDTGGITYKGIAKNKNPDWDGWDIIMPVILKHSGNPTKINEELEKNQVLQDKIVDFYYKNYWKKCRCDEIVSEKVAATVFDFAVNAGCKQAIKTLQKTVNLLNNEGKIVKDIVVDGLVGPATISAVNTVVAKRDSSTVVKTYNFYRFNFYESISYGKTNERFIVGWINRITY